MRFRAISRWITNASELPIEFLEPSPQQQVVIIFYCEGVDLFAMGLCIMQLAFPDAIYLVDAIQGGEVLIKPVSLHLSYITKDPKFWTHRPVSKQMIRAATDDVHFLLYIYRKVMKKLNERSLLTWTSSCPVLPMFCIKNNAYADWPSLPPIPDNLKVDGSTPEEEILLVLDVPEGKMGLVILGEEGPILSIKESCNAEILIGGAKGPPDKVRTSIS